LRANHSDRSAASPTHRWSGRATLEMVQEETIDRLYGDDLSARVPVSPSRSDARIRHASFARLGHPLRSGSACEWLCATGSASRVARRGRTSPGLGANDSGPGHGDGARLRQPPRRARARPAPRRRPPEVQKGRPAMARPATVARSRTSGSRRRTPCSRAWPAWRQDDRGQRRPRWVTSSSARA
jgi:hypothetical protein